MQRAFEVKLTSSDPRLGPAIASNGLLGRCNRGANPAKIHASLNVVIEAVGNAPEVCLVEQQKLRITNPRQDWVRNELKILLAEWEAWADEVDQIQDHPIQEGLESDIFRDGKQNILKHQMLQEKTRAFLDNNVEGHNFIHGFEGMHLMK